LIEHMPGQQRYTDRGPRIETGIDRYPRDAHQVPAGGVMITTAEMIRVIPPHHPSEVQEIIRRGRQEPRRLTLEESRTADKNRAALPRIASGTSSFKPSGDQRHPPGTAAYGHGPRRTTW
jgi:hypothetical protein